MPLRLGMKPSYNIIVRAWPCLHHAYVCKDLGARHELRSSAP